MTDSGKKPFRIGFVSNSAWSVYNFRLDIIRHFLGQRDYEVLVAAPDDEFSALLTENGVHFVPIDFDNRTENPLADFRFYLRLRRLYRAHRPDIIFHYVAKPNIYGSLAASALRIPSVAVVTGLGYAFARKNWLYRLMKMLYRRAFRQSREVWFLNNEDARIFVEHKIVQIEKVKVLPGEGVNTGHFSPSFNGERKPGTRFRFLMSTRLLKSKGIGIYVDAARILRKKHPDVDFGLIGFFEKHHPDSITQEDLNRWEREGLVHYDGFARDVRPALLSADCFVFPSFYNEGIPRCLMEAASMELPIITSFNRGCKEVVLNNSTGYVCNMNDPFDLADKMEKMVGLTAEERQRMGRNGRQLVCKKFNVQKVIAEYEETLSKFRN